jgi:hypothetical protein
VQSLKRAVPPWETPFETGRVEIALSVMEACRRMSVRLRWYGFPQLCLEQVKEMDGGLIGAVVRDPRSRRSLLWTVDRSSGVVSFRSLHEPTIVKAA